MSKKKKSPATEKAAADDVFERSLDEYKGEDVQGTVRKKRKKSRKAVNAAFIAVIAVCAAVLVVCIVLIVKNISDKERGREVYDEAAAMFDPAAMAVTLISPLARTMSSVCVPMDPVDPRTAIFFISISPFLVPHAQPLRNGPMQEGIRG